MTKRGKPRPKPKSARPEMQIPTRENCNLEDPEEMFLWCFTGAGGITGAPLLMPLDYYRALSKHLHSCGARLSDAPAEKWRPPVGDTLSPLFAQGEWVPADAPEDEQDEVARIAAQLAPEIRRRTYEVLRTEFEKEASDGPV